MRSWPVVLNPRYFAAVVVMWLGHRRRAQGEPVAWTVMGAGERLLVEVGGQSAEEPAGFQCRIGDRLFSWRLCYGVFHVPGLLERTLSEPKALVWP